VDNWTIIDYCYWLLVIVWLLLWPIILFDYWLLLVVLCGPLVIGSYWLCDRQYWPGRLLLVNCYCYWTQTAWTQWLTSNADPIIGPDPSWWARTQLLLMTVNYWLLLFGQWPRQWPIGIVVNPIDDQLWYWWPRPVIWPQTCVDPGPNPVGYCDWLTQWPNDDYYWTVIDIDPDNWYDGRLKASWPWPGQTIGWQYWPIGVY